jgi:hypothetical protein
MVFLLVSTLLVGRPILVRAAISLAFAFLVEISQFYHAPWIDSIRQTTLGGLVLVSDFCGRISFATRSEYFWSHHRMADIATQSCVDLVAGRERGSDSIACP